MDSESLRTASTYLNNLLLARGLLRNGDPIDFVKPSRESRAQIINLVHDLILREDRSRDQREGVALTLRQLRADASRKTLEIERLSAKNEETARNAVAAQAAERAARVDVKSVEKAMKSLQDQAARLKISLQQVKTQCTNDVRKRDLELQRLKTHLQGQQRGNKASVVAPSITITPGVSGNAKRFDESVHNVDDPAYSLKQETTDFLTQLSQSLSDENDALIGLIRGALSTMKQLLGLPMNAQKLPDSAIGSRGSDHNGEGLMLHALPTSYEALSSDLEATMQHLKQILTNPNFVSMEEVEVREEEIVRLREGWERMEQRWKDVLVMMDGWRKRMESTGDTINLEDITRGLGLGAGLDSPIRKRDDRSKFLKLVEEQDESLVEQSQAEEEQDDSLIEPPPGESLEESELEREDAAEEPTVPLHQAAEEAILPSEHQTLFSPLKRSSPHRSIRNRTSSGATKRKHAVLEPPEFFDLRPSVKSSRPASPAVAENQAEEEYEPSERSLSLAEKLAAAQREAEEVAATKKHNGGSEDKENEEYPTLPQLDGLSHLEEQEDTLGKMPGPVKKTRIRGRARRRKSTLSPEELEELLCAV